MTLCRNTNGYLIPTIFSNGYRLLRDLMSTSVSAGIISNLLYSTTYRKFPILFSLIPIQPKIPCTCYINVTGSVKT